MDCNEYIEEKPFPHIRFFMMNTGDVFEDVFRAFVLRKNPQGSTTEHNFVIMIVF